MVEESYITHKEGVATTYVGPDATNLFRAKALRIGLKGWIKFKMIPTRGVTITKMLKMVTEYTGKKYTPKQAEQAVVDLSIWIDTMVTAMPLVEEK